MEIESSQGVHTIIHHIKRKEKNQPSSMGIKRKHIYYQQSGKISGQQY